LRKSNRSSDVAMISERTVQRRSILPDRPNVNLKDGLVTVCLIGFPTASILNFISPWLTLIPISLIVVVSAVVILKNLSISIKFIFAKVLPVFIVVLSYYVIEIDFVEEKFFLFVGVFVLFGVLLSFCFSAPTIRHHIPLALLLNGLIAFAILVGLPSVYQADRLSVEGANPIWVARSIGLISISAIATFVSGNNPRYVSILLIALSIFGIYLTGSRGPIIAIVFCILYSVYQRNRSSKLLLGLNVAYWIGMIALTLFVAEVDVDSRVVSLTNETFYNRLDLISFAWSQLVENLNGIGVGNFFVTSTLIYPHNIFLEFLVEWGLFYGGIIIFLIVLGSANLMRATNEQYFPLKLLLIYEIANACISGDVTSPRMLYGLVWLGLMPNFMTNFQSSVRSNVGIRQSLNGIVSSIRARRRV